MDCRVSLPKRNTIIVVAVIPIKTKVPVLYHVPGVLLVLLVLHSTVHQPPHHRLRLTWKKQVIRKQRGRETERKIVAATRKCDSLLVAREREGGGTKLLKLPR